MARVITMKDVNHLCRCYGMEDAIISRNVTIDGGVILEKMDGPFFQELQIDNGGHYVLRGYPMGTDNITVLDEGNLFTDKYEKLRRFV